MDWRRRAAGGVEGGRRRGKIIEMLSRVTAYDKCMPAMQCFCVNIVIDICAWAIVVPSP